MAPLQVFVEWDDSRDEQDFKYTCPDLHQPVIYFTDYIRHDSKMTQHSPTVTWVVRAPQVTLTSQASD